jgi:type IV pilus assembly protein PilM
MARRLIGLDVGTNAVTIAEVTPGTPPRLELFAQVALPRDAMREGEVADESAVADAVARLRAEVGIKKASVRVGIASPRVIVRQVEMPLMTRDELASALQFQASDLIPISIEDAVLDFAILGTNQPGLPDDGVAAEPTMQVLLAAAQEATVLRLVAAVEAGGLQVGAVDLIPLALTRALARPVPVPAAVAGGGVALDERPGAEGIVSFGGGVTSIAVHEAGVPRFVRVIGSGGRELTDAIASELEVPPETAEALKRALGAAATDEMVMRARGAIDRPLSVLLDEVRSSIDYYRNQAGAARLSRVMVTGGSALLQGLPERLAALVGVPVEPAYMRDLLRIGDIGFAPDDLPRLEPYLPAAVGLALGGAGAGVVVDLLPRTRRAGGAKARPRLNSKVAAGVAAAVVVFGGLTYLQHGKVSSAKSRRSGAETKVAKLQNQIGHVLAASSPRGQVANLQPQVAQLLGGDVAWTRTVDDVGAALPAGVWLTTFQAQYAAPTVGSRGSTTRSGATGTGGATGAAGTGSATTPLDRGAGTTAGNSPQAAPSPGGAAGSPEAARAVALANATCPSYHSPIAGSVTMAGIAQDLPALAAFLDALAQAGDPKNPDVTGVYLGTAQKAKFGDADVITFTVNATLASGARSDRLQSFFKEALCK